jgi:L-seryl-tRNA(Ser) seleniumtransferase/D-glucosaminate-6-phosphate ammonia-lyase
MAGFVWACRQAGVPALALLAGAEPGPPAALDAGADLVLLDPAITWSGPQAGLLAGRASLVEACRLQERGLGALFRPHPGTLAGVLATARAAAADLAAGRAFPEPTGAAA